MAGEPKVLLDGWGFQDTHETLNTFIWGPDGWLYVLARNHCLMEWRKNQRRPTDLSALAREVAMHHAW